MMGTARACRQERTMVREPVLECTFFIPICRDANLSDGEPHSTEAWEWLDDELFVQFGGRTIAPGLYDGFYRDPDTQERVPDQSRKYIVAVPKSQMDDLRNLLMQSRTVFQQKCIYLSVGGRVEFI
jgi:hypothetical protein